MNSDPIVVSSHVGRDILQSAQLFKTVEAATWEYVVNSLQYVDPGVAPEVTVKLDGRKEIVEIADNGRGMDTDGLKHFFTMHGENIERRKGTPGRGKFGTGKSAAFGIGDTLIVDTVRGRMRNVIELHAEDIESSDGSSVPTRWVRRNEPAPGVPNGTVVTIKGVQQKRMRTEPMIRTFERHLSFWRATSPRVLVGSHVCVPWEPDAATAITFTPPASLAERLGNARLLVKVARRPLEDGFRGVAVTAGPGNLVAIETAGVDAKEFGNYLFGEVDVPQLEETAFDGRVAAFDVTRSLSLNYEHPVAAALVGFIGSSLEEVRRGLVEENRRAKQQAEAERLMHAADEIAKILNDDLLSVAQRFAEMRNIRRRTAVAAPTGSDEAEDEPDTYREGHVERGLLDSVGPRERTDTPVTPTPEEDQGVPHGKSDPEGPDWVEPIGSSGKSKSKAGGLTVDFEHLGTEEERSFYDFDRKQILINLDHPAVMAAKGIGGVDDPAFRRLAYEIAFTQYSLAVAREVYENDPAITADDVLFEVRDALRRVTAGAAFLYAA